MHHSNNLIVNDSPFILLLKQSYYFVLDETEIFPLTISLKPLILAW